jgi:hypothetical protein
MLHPRDRPEGLGSSVADRPDDRTKIVIMDQVESHIPVNAPHGIANNYHVFLDNIIGLFGQRSRQEERSG